MIAYHEAWTFAANVAELAMHYAGKVRDLETQRARIESGPNAPALKANDLAALDAHLEKARRCAAAAAAGAVFHDPRDPSGADHDTQMWRCKAREVGMLVSPDNFEPSLHATKAFPLKVIRGGDGAFNLGSPTMTAR